jgi:hypothetical protein
MSAEPLQPQDLQLLQSLKQGGHWLRAVLCTLGRRGVALRSASPERARAILDALSTLPYYKGGQFVFDLLELEDFMLDGPPPEVLPTALDPAALQRIAGALNAVKRSLDGQPIADDMSAAVSVQGGSATTDLPPLEAGFYLYQDVALGIWTSVVEVTPITS